MVKVETEAPGRGESSRTTATSSAPDRQASSRLDVWDPTIPGIRKERNSSGIITAIVGQPPAAACGSAAQLIT